MTFAVKLIIVIINTFLFVAAFRYAAGSLSLRKLNLYNTIFYFILIFAYIGATLTFLGFRNHYLLQKITSEDVFIKGYFIMAYSVIILPVTIALFNKILGIKKPRIWFDNYINKKTDIASVSEDKVFVLCIMLTVVGAVALAYVFICYGGVPIIQQLLGSDTTTSRMAISRGFTGNQYIKNILALALIPALSYLAFIYARCTKKPKWILLFVALFILAVICKTYNLEKAPLVLYIFYFYLIECLLGNVKNLKKILLVLVVGIVLILIAYSMVGYSGKIFSLTNGPMSRLFITQIATLFLHVQAFPSVSEYLMGSSFPTILGGAGIRSGRVVMEIYNAKGIADGTAGVMNTLYIGEAYANYGWVGVIIGPILVGIILSVIPMIFMKQRKDPINITIYVVLCMAYIAAIIAGFTDFFYSAGTIVIVVILLLVKLIASGGTFTIRTENNIEISK